MIKPYDSKEESKVVDRFLMNQNTKKDLANFRRLTLLPYLNSFMVTDKVMSVVSRSGITKAEVTAITIPYNKNKIQLSAFFNQLK